MAQPSIQTKQQGRTMQLVEQHLLRKGDPRFACVDQAAFAAKNLYNAANYLVRQSFIFQGEYLNYYAMHAQMKGHETYQALPRKVSQQVLRMLDKNWQGFFKAMKAYRADPSKFRKKPGLPHYLDKTDGRYVLVYTVQALSKPALKRGVIVPSELAIELPTKQTRIAQVRQQRYSPAPSNAAGLFAIAPISMRSVMAIVPFLIAFYRLVSRSIAFYSLL